MRKQHKFFEELERELSQDPKSYSKLEKLEGALNKFFSFKNTAFSFFADAVTSYVNLSTSVGYGKFTEIIPSSAEFIRYYGVPGGLALRAMINISSYFIDIYVPDKINKKLADHIPTIRNLGRYAAGTITASPHIIAAINNIVQYLSYVKIIFWMHF